LFPAHNFIGDDEKRAVIEVLEKGKLSGFLAGWNPSFFGGEKVREFEQRWADYVGAKHAVTFNSNTSGLFAAIGAAGVGPGDEVIVTPYSMSATATVIIAYNGVPVFADITDDIYCLDPQEIQNKITPRTKAIMVTDVFGHAADIDEIMAIAAEHNLIVIEDAAQAPGAVYKGRMVGALSHITVFSLNFHKHIHTGEGGIATTNDDLLAEKLQLIRNHGETVVAGKGTRDIANAFGFNLRYTEIPAAIAIEQLRKLPDLLDRRIGNAEYLASGLDGFPGIHPSAVREGCRHVYYVQPFRFEAEVVGVQRDLFISAVAAELPSSPDAEGRSLIWPGFVEPLYLQPMYQQQIAYGKTRCPFKCPHYKNEVDYHPGLCPVTERVEREELFLTDFIRPPATSRDMDDVLRAFDKVYENQHELRD
jgi:dTDP-4-amino-4,6-dideoxygalactose transaminase